MFIAYNAASSGKDNSVRRMINKHVAATTSVKQLRSRRKANGRVPRKSAEFTRALNWFPSPCHTIVPSCPRQQSKESVRDEEQASARHTAEGSQACSKLTITPFAGGRFYPIKSPGDNSQGPLLLPALTHYFDILVPYDAKVVGLGQAERDSYLTDLIEWTAAHKEVLHSLAGFSLCILYHDNSDKSIHQAILYHRQELLKAVRQRLSSQMVDDVLLHTLCILISIDESLGFNENRPVHLEGLQAVIRARQGGNGAINSTSSSGTEALAERSPLGMVVLVNNTMVEFHLQINRGFYQDVAMLASPSHITLSQYEKVSNLPPGFADLAHTGTITIRMVDLLDDFAAWFYTGMGTDCTYREPWRYSNFEPVNGVEKCISIALVSLADDLSAMGSAPCAVIFRQADQRAKVFLSYSRLWTLLRLEDLGIWLATVIATPKKKSLLSRDKQTEVLKASIQDSKDYHSSGKLDAVLRRFFYDETRVADWKDAWEVALAL